ncbi:ATP-binding protein [Massilia sp. IC2-476]|uniref:hybrid sensor histidine kinase/response regulator n=1 Tax=Massilia sp. IC2-476 TaxID=2887199 RepID=UPI001D118BD3|nr:ATP-binding protein [Massilia sp. IC2-476]MCC2971876.1 response regulator [Massilia sp. IC2-476]
MKVRSHIALLAAAILVPTVVFSIVVLNVLLTAEREAALRSMQELARASVNAMDREMTFAMATARTLQTSRNLKEGKFEGFYGQAVDANTGRDTHTALLDERGQQVFNTVRPYGTSIPAPNAAARERVRAVLAGGKPVYSDLIKGSATGKYVVSVEAPVTIGDGRRFVVNEWMFSDRLNSILPAKNIPSSWLIAVFDKRGITIARNIHPEKFVGSPPRGERLKTILAGYEGISRAMTRDGVEMYGAWQRSTITGWMVGVGVPVAEIERTAVHSVALSAAGFLIALLCAIGAAILFSRRLVSAIDAAAAAAEDLPSYRVPPVADLRVEEMNRLQMALHRAGRLLVAGEASRRQVVEEARTARIHAEQAQKVAERQNRAKDEFLAMLGHELRNPLAAISSGVAMLSMGGTDAERTTKIRDILQHQTRHLTHLVDELLDAHRILNGKIALAPTQVDLQAAVQSCLAAFEARGATRTHELALQLAPATIEADPTRLEQMIANLLDNALKYTPEGGRIGIALHTGNGEAVLAISDTGIGMTPELMAQAFEVFVQGEVVNRAKGGLGIGLAVVDALAKLHGATLAADSPGPGQGSTFTLRFPLVHMATTPQPSLPAAPAHSHARVLVIEDNGDVREMMRMLLAEQGFEVCVAPDGAGGIEAARSFRPDIALVDIDLPDMSGYAVAGALRKDAATAAIPLLAVTGYGQAADRDKALAAGFDGHLAKPVPADVLVEAIARLVHADRLPQ